MIAVERCSLMPSTLLWRQKHDETLLFGSGLLQGWGNKKLTCWEWLFKSNHRWDPQFFCIGNIFFSGCSPSIWWRIVLFLLVGVLINSSRTHISPISRLKFSRIKSHPFKTHDWNFKSLPQNPKIFPILCEISSSFPPSYLDQTPQLHRHLFFGGYTPVN